MGIQSEGAGRPGQDCQTPQLPSSQRLSQGAVLRASLLVTALGLLADNNYSPLALPSPVLATLSPE